MTSTVPASSLLLMSPEDNCLIARLELKAGTRVTIDGRRRLACQTLCRDGMQVQTCP